MGRVIKGQKIYKLKRKRDVVNFKKVDRKER